MNIPVLKIRDENGNFIPINAIRGEDGKSAYEQAKEGGYTGTEEQFIALLNGLTNTEDAEHYSDFNNPHKVTALQTGAIPEAYPASDDLDIELKSGGSKMKVCSYHSGTQNTPYSQGLTQYAHGMVITNAYDSAYGTQLCMPSGIGEIYVRHSNVARISEWVKLGTNEALESHIFDNEKHILSNPVGGFSIGKNAQVGSVMKSIQLGDGANTDHYTLKVFDHTLLDSFGKVPSDRLPFASGSYKGTNTYGISKPNSLTFDFVPKFVIVSQRGERNATGGGCFIWISQGTTLNFINNGSTYWVHPTLTDKTLSWYCTESASYQLNSSNYEYDYFAWG